MVLLKMTFKRSARLIVYASAVYAIGVYLYRGLLPANLPSAVTLLAVPLFLLIVIFSSDLLSRARLPSKTEPNMLLGRSLNHEVELLSRQVEVAGRSSSDYYETVLISRLRELLVDKVTIETGMDRVSVKQRLFNPTLGLSLLGDPALYSLLFTSNRVPSRDRQRTLEIVADKIGRWKA